MAMPRKRLWIPNRNDGLCECGCGIKTSLAKVTNTARGRIKGQPMRFIHNHHLKGSNNNHYKNGWNYKKTENRWYITCRDGTRMRWSHIIYQNYYLNGSSIPDGFLVHHKNENKSDDSPENLKLVTPGDHCRIHNNKKIILIKEHEELEFSSYKEAEKFLGLKQGAISASKYYKCKIKGFYVIAPEKLGSLSIEEQINMLCTKKNKKIILQKDNKTSLFSSITEAGKFLGLKNTRGIRDLIYRCRTQKYDYHFIGG